MRCAGPPCDELKVDRAGHIRLRLGGDQGLGVGMLRIVEQRVGRGLLHDHARAHDGDFIGDARHHRQIVADEKIAQMSAVADIFQQRQDLVLYGHIERRSRLIANQQNRVQRQGARDRQALALAAGKSMWIALCHHGVETDEP